MELSTGFAVGDGLIPEPAAASTPAVVVGPSVNEELPMPTATGRASLKTRLVCLTQLIAASLMASLFIGVPLAAALHLVLDQPLLDIIFASAITAELGLMVAYIVLKTENSVKASPA
jgi:hypothetical protein